MDCLQMRPFNSAGTVARLLPRPRDMEADAWGPVTIVLPWEDVVLRRMLFLAGLSGLSFSSSPEREAGPVGDVPVPVFQDPPRTLHKDGKVDR